MMGQTFDDGQPVDMIKYALFMMNLKDIVAKNGVDVHSNWLIADHFITDINQEKSMLKAKEQVKKRIKYIQRLNEVYKGNIGVVLSSELSKRNEYKKKLSVLMQEAKNNVHFKETVLKAVPKDKRNNPCALQYPFEELATIQTMDANIKIGPAYEIFYDEPAREFSSMIGFNRYVAIHLTNGYPFGNPNISIETAKQIESFGVLPYKITSKGLCEYRIDPINDDLEKIQTLVYSTSDKRAVIDLIVIAELAKQRLQGNNGILFLSELKEKISDSKQISDLAFKSYKEFIHKPIFGIENKES